MGSDIQVLLAQESAYDVIDAETIKSRDVETGGLLVGRQVLYQDRPVLVILFASGPGQEAQRSPLSFVPDHQSNLRDLREWRRRYARYEIDFVGVWHKHPPGLSVPTAGDVRQALGILNDPDYVLPHGGILIPITQLVQDGCGLHIFYITQDQPQPNPLPYDVVKFQVLEQFLDEILHPDVEESKAPNDSSGLGDHSGVSRERSFCWGKPPADLPGSRSYDFRGGQGRVIVGNFKVIDEKASTDSEPEMEKGKDALSDDLPDSMTQQALLREIQRLERMGQQYGFKVQRSPGDELDYVELVLLKPVPIPYPGEPVDGRRPVAPDGELTDADNDSQAMPTQGELASSVRVAFPHNYPDTELSMWVAGERDYPVKLGVLRKRGAHSLGQQVELVMRWLLKPHSKGLPSLIEANVEYLYRQTLLPTLRSGVDTLDDLLKSLEEQPWHSKPVVDKGESLI
jgi:hypothetical protein